MLENKLNVEELIKRFEQNWPQEHQKAGPTTVRLIRAGDIMLSIARKRFEQFGLTPAEFDTLSTLRKLGEPYEAGPSNICQANLLSSGGLTKVLNNLEQRGLIARHSHVTDKRSRLVRLTGDGLKLIEAAMASVLDSHDSLFSVIFTEEESAQLNQLLSKFHHQVEKLL